MRFDVSTLDPTARKQLTFLVQDEKNPRVKWEMGLVSARAIRHPGGAGVVDYQAIWRLPRGVVRGNVLLRHGVPVRGSLSYFDPRLYTETGQGFTSWVTEHFSTHEEFQSVSQRIAAAVAELPKHEIPTINWSTETLCLPTSTKRPE